MRVDCLLDTNVLVHAAAGGTDPRRKQALELVEGVDFGLSAQVLQEFYVTVTRKIAEPLSADAALEWIEQWQAFPVLPIDVALVKNAVVISRQHMISYWDGAIVSAAHAMGAGVVYTEDLNHGQDYGGVTVQNPFLT